MNDAGMVSPRQATIRAGDIDLHYLEWGSGPRTLVCLHGTSMQAHGWTRLASDLMTDHRVIALNMRGHGRSARPRGTYDIPTYRDDLAAFADALRLERFHIVGSSVGTQVATAFAARYPARAAGLVLSDPSLAIKAPAIEYYVKLHRTRPRAFATFAEAEAFARALPQRAGFSEAMHKATAMGDFFQRPDGRWEWCYDLDAILDTFRNLVVDQTADIRAVECPVLILQAATSHVLSAEDAARLGNLFRNARVVAVESSSHTIWGDRPELLSRLTRDFIAETSGAAS